MSRIGMAIPCKRCGGPLLNQYKTKRIEVQFETHLDPLVSDRAYLLCPACYKEFREWIGDPEE